MKRLVKFAVALVVLLVVAAAAVVFSIDSIAKQAVEMAGTHVLGTPTTVGSMRIGLLNPSASMTALAVDNPSSFAGDAGGAKFLALQNGSLAVDAKSLMGDVVRIPSVRLSDLSLTLVQKGSESNATAILDHMKRTVGGSGGGSGGGSSSSSRRFVIDELLIENISIRATASGLPVEVPAANLKVARIRLESLGSGGKDPVGMEQLVAIVVNAVMQAAIEAGASQLPAQLVQGMLGGMSGLGGGLANFNLSIDSGSGLQPVGDLGTLAKRAGVDLSALSGKAGEEVQKGLGDVGKQLEDAGSKATEGIKKGLDDILKPK
ncbi:MAG: hypothetical protein FJ253_01290 [Phycisphaerae bacterium]|nr:hypothetical protein [Phycisphaerae bacterium]